MKDFVSRKKINNCFVGGTTNSGRSGKQTIANVVREFLPFVKGEKEGLDSLQFLLNCGLTNKSAPCVVIDRIVTKANQFLKTRKIKLKQREHLAQPVFKSQGVGGMIACPSGREDIRFVYG